MQFYIREELRVPAAVGVLAFSAGVGVGYFVCHKRLNGLPYQVEETVDVDWEEEDREHNQLAMDFAMASRENLEQTVVEAVTSAKVIDFPHPEPDPEPEMETVEDEWDQEAEEADRGPDAPYVIHREEFFAGTTGYAQDSLEFFAGDGITCDDHQVPVYNADKILGRLEFGRGSGDSDIVYIRNESLKAEYEITRNPGSYQTEVLGIEAEEEAEENDLKHSVRRFRDTD
jgi:hypothetical protein